MGVIEDRGFTISRGHEAVCLAFGIVFVAGGGHGPFSGSYHRPPGSSAKKNTWGGRVNATESRPSGSSKPLLAGSQQLTGYVHQCISELGQLELLWVNFCYRDSCARRSECYTKFFHQYSQQYSALHCAGLNYGTRTRIREMIAWRLGVAGGVIPASAQFESIRGPISRQSWTKTYKDHWNRLGADMHRVDQAALYKIGVKIQHQ